MTDNDSTTVWADAYSWVPELRDERRRQEAKFPDQHLLSGPLQAMMHTDTDVVRARVDNYAIGGYLMWADVLAEEFAEAMDVADGDHPDELRGELIQVAAVCLRWIADIDRAANVAPRAI